MSEHRENPNEGASLDEVRTRGKKHKPSIRVAALNITSFMDLTFNLLLFFILTASFAIGEGVMPADLPVGTGAGSLSSTTGPPKTALIIRLSSYGALDRVGIQIEGTTIVPTDFEELYNTLRGWRRDNKNNGQYDPDNPIIIKPDRGVTWKHVVEAFNTIVRARYTNVSFAAVQGG